MVDVVSGELPAAGARVHTDVVVRAGGSAVNAARCAVELGASATVVGRVGADAAGELVRHSLLDAGIAAHLARDEALPTGVAIALGSGQGAGIVAARGANARLAETDIPDPIDGDALLVSGFALFQEGSAAAARAGLRRFRGQWSAIDLAAPRLVAGVDLSDVAEDARVVFATTDEAKAVTGTDGVDAASQLAEHFEIACV